MLLSLPHPSLYFPSKTPKTPKPLLLPSLSVSLSISPSTPSPASTETLPKSAIQRISEKLRSLGYLESTPSPPPQSGVGSAGEIFIPTPHELPKHRVGYTIDSSWSTPENPVPDPGSGATITRFRELWREEKERERAAKSSGEAAAPPTVAELTIPAGELRRLRRVGIRLERRLKVGKAGITEGIVNGIHERWRRSELVKIKCEDLCRMNMKRTHEILERKTGGLVVWRSGSIIILYRGVNYEYPYFNGGVQDSSNLDNIAVKPVMDKGVSREPENISLSAIDINPSADSPNASPSSSLVIGVGSPKKLRLQLPGEAQLEEEADRLLNGLGPRFTDWWGYEPLPVDADLLPAIVPGFRKPFRLLPFGVKPKLTDREMTILRRLGRPLPCHFALGKNRNLQGLAVSMIKLWERCEVAKIAVKRGVQNTNSNIMAEELKHLTGGTLLSRDKDFIIFYRGKDFLPPAVSIAIEERRNSEIGKQKQSTHGKSPMNNTAASQPRLTTSASVDEHQEANEQKRSPATERRLNPEHLAIKKLENKLSVAVEKKEKAEELLAELEKSVKSPAGESDKEAISKEERYMLRKVGLRMKPFLLLGRRGVFAGTVENMHLHWKYRELVKIICNDRSIEHVESAARTLEAESGGILVAVERMSKGHAIIVYRGKNYQRPATLRPKTLLNKKEAMRRSLEAQRRESLKLNVLSLSRNIDQLGHQMAKCYSAVDAVQSSECKRSEATDELNDQNPSTERDHGSIDNGCHQEDPEVRHEIAEVSEANAESLHFHERHSVLSNTDDTTNISDKDNWKVPIEECNFIRQEDAYHSSEPKNGTNTSCKEAGVFDECEPHPETCPQQTRVSFPTTSNLSHFSNEEVEEVADLSFGATHSKHALSGPEDKLDNESDLENSFKAAPLSNRERLILRKQALKTRKRPVLAVGRSNIVTGVAKTIKTHFKKHPLAIVNIKGRAKGTSVQEVIFELEQATGAVLVSREPNKVILYRGWGEGEVPGGGVKEKQDVRKGSGGVTEDERMSPMLLGAIRLECGLSTS